jgi:acetylornithine deacetylase/succinyl-diaminopimelate desuccinylase-like protein
MTPFERPLGFAVRNRQRFVSQLQELVGLASVSGDHRYDREMGRCAAWLAAELRRIGLKKVRVIATDQHPVVYGEWLEAPGKATILIYGHYDVLQPGPSAGWLAPPFAAEIRGDYLYGRGACDDKGQFFAHLKGIEACMATDGVLPLNVRVLLDGEEEVGSPSLISLLESSADACRSDAVVISDMPMLGRDLPALTYSMRGALGLEIEMQGAPGDLHSGVFGGAVDNPLQALCRAVANMHNNGEISVPGFYEDVRQCDAAELHFMATRGPSDQEMLAQTGARAPWGEPGFSLYERTTIRPALNLNGIVGGHQSAGSKAVIPARATAKVDIRLVPDQDLHRIEGTLRRHVALHTPPSMLSRVRRTFAAEPVLIARRDPAQQAAARALAFGFGAQPAFVRCGGTLPIAAVAKRVLHCPIVLMGLGLPDDGMHAANERFHLPTFHKGIAAAIACLFEISKSVRPRQQASTSRLLVSVS